MRAGTEQDHSPGSAANPLVLHGEIQGSQNHSYVEVPFRVPAMTSRVTLTFSYTEKEQRTTLDLGLEDTAGLRCWSGGNKRTLTVSLSDATPSCLPGPIPAGTWNVLIGVPNIRPGVKALYTLSIAFDSNGLVADEPLELRVPLRKGPAWYRGDLHMHTGHSDGQCPSQTGKLIPCPVFFTADAAAKRGLDFIAITDHNATSQYDSMRELQPYFDKLLLISGREITTFYGHLNLLGTTEFVDFRLGSKSVPDVDTLLRNMDKTGALTSINHPRDDSGERCMGCGWTPLKPVDMSLLSAVEAVNSGSEDPEHSGIPFWEEQLNRGYRLTAIGGSDNHRPMLPLDQLGSIGSPTTVVYAADLSTSAILAGIKAGHVFIDLTGSKNRMLDVTATLETKTAHMGDKLRAPKDGTVHFDAHMAGVATGKVIWIEDAKPIAYADSAVSDDDQTKHLTWTSDGKRHWIRADVVGPEGQLWLLGNPVYLNWEEATQSRPVAATKNTDAERVQLATQALLALYKPEKGVFDTMGWWNSANAITTLADESSAGQSSEFAATFANTFKQAQLQHPNFLNKFYDDEGWWALAWLGAYEKQGNEAYLHMAQTIFDDMAGGWDDTCGGGIWWNKDRNYKNAIANELFLSVAARLALHSSKSGRQQYLKWANREWTWFAASGMINDHGLINDGLSQSCKNNGAVTWSYNQGVILGGLADLSVATHDKNLLQPANKIAIAVTEQLVDSDGILREPCEPACSGGGDVPQFKGIFVRNLARLQRSSPDPRYAKLLRTNAEAVWNRARTDDNHFSVNWFGPPQDGKGGALGSALDVLVGAESLDR